MEWQPILENEFKEKAETVLIDIDTALSKEINKIKNFALCDGYPGLLVYWGYRNYNEGTTMDPTLIEKFLNKLIKDSAKIGLGGDMLYGYTGIAWLLEHLREKNQYNNIHLDLLNQVYSIMPASIKFLEETRNIDNFSGLSGICNFLLEKLPNPVAKYNLLYALEVLDSIKVEDSNGTKWMDQFKKRNPPNPSGSLPADEYNLGLAHGIPCLIVILSRLFKANIKKELSYKLLESTVQWLLSQQFSQGSLSRFPNVVTDPISEYEETRLAFCYGDLGISCALYQAAINTNNQEWINIALDTALRASKRDIKNSGVVDGGFCHGAAGNAHLFNRLFQYSKDVRFKDAALYWYERFFEVQRSHKSNAGYLTWGVSSKTGKVIWSKRTGLIDGIAGIGLCLMGGIYKNEPQWDRLFLLS